MTIHAEIKAFLQLQFDGL